jgi:hypothetical protein
MHPHRITVPSVVPSACSVHVPCSYVSIRDTLVSRLVRSSVRRDDMPMTTDRVDEYARSNVLRSTLRECQCDVPALSVLSHTVCSVHDTRRISTVPLSTNSVSEGRAANYCNISQQSRYFHTSEAQSITELSRSHRKSHRIWTWGGAPSSHPMRLAMRT